MLKYEYLTVMRGIRDVVGKETIGLTNLLNEYAKDGWWLFAIYPYAEGEAERVVFERVQEPKKSKIGRTLN